MELVRACTSQALVLSRSSSSSSSSYSPSSTARHAHTLSPGSWRRASRSPRWRSGSASSRSPWPPCGRWPPTRRQTTPTGRSSSPISPDSGLYKASIRRRRHQLVCSLFRPAFQ
uniref:Uncharacterized protein n=1 Tax=Zea mays TaxID=4577 RepID=B4FEH0_MAIZE|nr:unknown [Zea mays]